jgi:hypothetical protein
VLVAVCACSRLADGVDQPAALIDPGTFTVAGYFSIPPLGRFPPSASLPFGGISGLAPSSAGPEILGISDDHPAPRVYRFRIIGESAAFRVETAGLIPLEPVSDGLTELDPEGIAVLPDGNLLIASEGRGNTEPRVPPALVEFDPSGRFIRRLPLRDRYEPNPKGALVKGVRSNMGLESLTLAPGGQRLYAAAETALVQDGEVTTFERGSPARILEYVRRGGSYEPGREFVYMVEPIIKPSFEPGLAVNGLADLLALANGQLLSLERSYVQEMGGARQRANRIRVFRIDFASATDVSALDSLTGAPSYVPVAKRLVQDMSDLDGLPPELAPSLDNFEGLAFGPSLPDGRPTLLLVSDDNFNPAQRTWFLQLAIGTPRRAQRVQ